MNFRHRVELAAGKELREDVCLHADRADVAVEDLAGAYTVVNER